MPEEANDGDVLDMARQYFGHGNWNAKYWFIGPEPGQAAGENDDLLRRAKAWRDLGGGELNDCREFHDRPVFKQNRHLLHDLPSIGAAVVELWVKETHGVRPLIMVVPHTFGGYLNFNCHLHILVSDGGLNESQGQWLAGLMFDQDALMRLWRDAVLNYLRMALKADVLRSNRSVKFLESVFTSEAARPKWIIYISESMSKRHFLSYAARYAKRLPRVP